MSIGRIDLNLIKVFDAVHEDRNLLRAGKRLNLSQSAVSHALTRLREVVGDELFVRTAKGMVPTARAVAMADDLRDSLRRIEATLGVEQFDPQRSTRRFVIAANDHLTAVMVAELSRLMRAEAPGIDLVIRPSTRIDLAEQIDVGRIDLALGIFAQVPSRLSSRTLMTQGESIVMRKGHAASRRKLALQDLARYPLVTVSVGGQEEGAVGGLHSGARPGAAGGDVRPPCARRGAVGHRGRAALPHHRAALAGNSRAAAGLRHAVHHAFVAGARAGHRR